MKCTALERHGVEVVERIPLEVPPNPANVGYLQTKALRMGHILPILDGYRRRGTEAGRKRGEH
jgi:3,4-dihydroxy 2-butanone 4-phosphate synthase/GTP cyclohydrolase II